MASTENEIYAVLGIEPPSQQPEAADPAAGANEQGVAGPDGAEAADSRDQANGEGDAGRAAAPRSPDGDEGRAAELARVTQYDRPYGERGTGDAGRDRAAGDRPDKDAGGEEQSGERPPQQQSRAERAEQARLRREREQKAAIDAAVLAERQKNEAAMKAMFEAAGMVDRYHDNKPITTMEEFDAFQAARQADRLNRELQSGKLTPESFQAAVDNTPAVREAKAIVERVKAEEDAREAERQKAEFDRQVEREFEEIRKINPKISSLDDILGMSTANEFTRLVRDNGMSFLDAFKLANMDDILKAQTAAAAEGAARSQQSKAHLRSINPGGQVSVDVPPDVVANYRMFDPNITLEEIQRDYGKRYRQ